MREIFTNAVLEEDTKKLINKNIKRMLNEGKMDYWLKEAIMKTLLKLNISDLIELEVKKRLDAK